MLSAEDMGYAGYKRCYYFIRIGGYGGSKYNYLIIDGKFDDKLFAVRPIPDAVIRLAARIKFGID